MGKYKPVIGLEIHVELKTKSKMFCQCDANYFGAKPNSHVCPVCLGLPGALPVPNKKAIEWTILLGKALNCHINSTSKFDRKHYFYPDLPKGYQISQYDEPIAAKGEVVIPNSFRDPINSKMLKQVQHDNNIVRIHRVHLEEDTGKLIHEGNDTLIDFNRSGTPLVEIVTEPDFDNVDDVKRFLEELQVIIRYLDISDADMEKGTMRLEPNISISMQSDAARHPELVSGSRNKFRTTSGMLKQVQHDSRSLPPYKVEVKNINSFRFVKQAIEYEIKRQIEILDTEKLPIQETRGFDEKKQITYSQRSKEEAHDYRYFPEPDIPPLTFSSEYIESIKIPELPSVKLERYVKDYGLRIEDAFRVTRDKSTADYFEGVSLKLKTQMLKLQLKTKNLYQVIANLIINKKISTELSVYDFTDKAIKLLTPQETDKKSLDVLINRLIETNPKVVEDYKKGKTNAIMFLVGQVMRELKGKADAKLVIETLKTKLT